MLTHTLRKLEDNQLVARTFFPVVPPKVEYTDASGPETGKRISRSLRLAGETLRSLIGSVRLPVIVIPVMSELPASLF